MPIPDDTASVRLDLWLWAARFFKTRALAKQAIETGKVEVGGQRAKPARGVRVGDVLHVARLDEHFEIEVLALSVVRGPASVAQTLYRERPESAAARAAAAETRRLQGTSMARPPKRPDKRARRLIRALGDLDML